MLARAAAAADAAAVENDVADARGTRLEGDMMTSQGGDALGLGWRGARGFFGAAAAAGVVATLPRDMDTGEDVEGVVVAPVEGVDEVAGLAVME